MRLELRGFFFIFLRVVAIIIVIMIIMDAIVRTSNTDHHAIIGVLLDIILIHGIVQRGEVAWIRESIAR